MMNCCSYFKLFKSKIYQSVMRLDFADLGLNKVCKTKPVQQDATRCNQYLVCSTKHHLRSISLKLDRGRENHFVSKNENSGQPPVSGKSRNLIYA